MTLRVVFVGGFPDGDRPAAGGVEVATTRLAAALVQEGVHVTVVASGASREEDGVRVVGVDADRRLSLARSLGPWREAVAPVVRRLTPDVVHGHGLLDGGLPAVDAPFPSVVSAHGNHASDTRASGRTVAAEARILATQRLARRVVRRADAVVSVHPDPRVNLPAVPRRFVTIPSIVDDAFWKVTRNPQPGRVLYCGGSRRIKGPDLFASAWPEVCARIPHASVELVGWPAGEPLPEGLEEAEVIPWLPPAGLAGRLARVEAVVIPSRFEVAPITLLEAWAAGVPVVSTRVGGVPAIATGAAVLVDAEPGAIAAGIVSVLHDARHVATLVSEGRRRSQQSAPARVAQAHIDLYRALVR